MERTLAADTTAKTDQEVLLKGWVNSVRKHGNVTFIDLRDRTGLVQVVFADELLGSSEELKPEYVVEIEGVVRERGERYKNPKLASGDVEVGATKLTVLNEADTPPFPLDTDGLEIDEDLRLEYRYLDLRRTRMTQNIRKRSEMTQFVRNWLVNEGFAEIETPVITKTTPEGARDFLIPSRLQPGNFYALPQSPQQYKQMLMVAGFERYFQLARCFRDEDPRADRAYGEFTQIDIEMSFVTQEDIMNLAETMFTELVETLFPEKRIKQKPWPRIPYHEAMEKYNSDKPDLRDDKDDPNELAFAWVVDFPLFAEQTDDDFYHGSGSAKFAPSHHMFTAPHPDDIGLLSTDPMKARGLQHDMVLNGSEVGGGSIRIHDAKIQETIFELIGFSEEQKAQFTHMLKAFTYGVPPHGGVAPGLDRLLYRILGEPNLREVMAFPAQASGRISVMDAPSPVDKSQLDELHISVRE
ncbi:aspartate--tRNA ligase [candidate division WWE3 bacterium]|uniref:Aspartate--tRNA(Asp/Asn) ligase n=1 Tax=candidate division WWE3 bacterium TaxID=2053526 RepID=A0A955LL00_UNCKA|nr:aspartate--tRNA ligase [candidate division WWE3 bacterium]